MHNDFAGIFSYFMCVNVFWFEILNKHNQNVAHQPTFIFHVIYFVKGNLPENKERERDGSNGFEMFNEANLFTEKEIYYIHMKCDSNEIRSL